MTRTFSSSYWNHTLQGYFGRKFAVQNARNVHVLWSEMIEIRSVLLDVNFLQFPSSPKISDWEAAASHFFRQKLFKVFFSAWRSTHHYHRREKRHNQSPSFVHCFHFWTSGWRWQLHSFHELSGLILAATWKVGSMQLSCTSSLVVPQICNSSEPLVKLVLILFKSVCQNYVTLTSKKIFTIRNSNVIINFSGKQDQTAISLAKGEPTRRIVWRVLVSLQPQFILTPAANTDTCQQLFQAKNLHILNQLLIVQGIFSCHLTAL